MKKVCKGKGEGVKHGKGKGKQQVGIWTPTGYHGGAWFPTRAQLKGSHGGLPCPTQHQYTHILGMPKARVLSLVLKRCLMELKLKNLKTGQHG